MYFYVCPDTVLLQDWFREYKNRNKVFLFHSFSSVGNDLGSLGASIPISALIDLTPTDMVRIQVALTFAMPAA